MNFHREDAVKWLSVCLYLMGYEVQFLLFTELLNLRRCYFILIVLVYGNISSFQLLADG